MKYMGTLTLRVPEDLERSLERQSQVTGVSKSDLAREALRRYLAVAEFQLLRAKLVPRAQLRGVNTDGDVFRRLDRS